MSALFVILVLKNFIYYSELLIFKTAHSDNYSNDSERSETNI